MSVKLNRYVNLLVMLTMLNVAGCSQNAGDELAEKDSSRSSVSDSVSDQGKRI